MAPWWPGTALLSTKVPRKLVFLFTLSLSVTYLFYNLLSCYSSLQFPLQDAGVYLQPEHSLSPEGTIRTASLQPDTSSEAKNYRLSPPRDAGLALRTISGSSQVPPAQSKLGINIIKKVSSSGVENKKTPVLLASISPSGFNNPRSSRSTPSLHPKAEGKAPDVRQFYSTLSPSLRKISIADSAPVPGIYIPSPALKTRASNNPALTKSPELGISTFGSAPSSYTERGVSTSDSAPGSFTEQGISNLDSAPISFTEEAISTLDSAPSSYTGQGISTSDSAPGSYSEQRFSTLNSASSSYTDQRIGTLDSAPGSYTESRISTLDSAPGSYTERRISTLDSAPGSYSDQRISTLDSAAISSNEHRTSTLDNAPLPFTTLRFSTPGNPSIASSATLGSNPKDSAQRPNTSQDSPLGPRYVDTVNESHVVNFSTTDSSSVYNSSIQTQEFSSSVPDSASTYPEVKDFSWDHTKPYTGIPRENSGSYDLTGNETQNFPRYFTIWGKTPLAATEMIPESQTGFLERDPQESSTTEDDLSRRVPVNSTPEYGDKRLPQAIIIGVKKGGTRALLEALRAHPDVRAVGVEPHFFDRNYEKGLEWYRDLMPRTIDGQITMEKTPSYFVTNEAPQRIHSMAKDTKLIVVVRNPVTRAISDYTQTLSKKPEIATFEVLAFKNRTLGLIDASWSALRIGIYALHLESWMQYFPLSQILFVSGEHLISNPAEEMAKVQEFLGLRRIITDKYFYFNKTKGFPCLKKPEDTGAPRCLGKSKGRTHPKIDPDVIHRLKKFYKPFNAMFYQMTGQDFQWEKEELES
ncbi:uncharacterized protein O3C94_019042 [Discoglossus pictus]